MVAVLGRSEWNGELRMAFFDDLPDEDQDVVNTDARQKILAALASGRGKPPILGRPAQDQPDLQQPSAPSDSGRSSETPRLLGLDSRPRIPAQRVAPVTPPTFDNPSASRPSILGAQPGPTPPILPKFDTPPASTLPLADRTTNYDPVAESRTYRPNSMPTREDFPAKPELGGWKKGLGLGLAVLAGSPQVTETILHGQRDKAERQFGQATQDWERGLSDEARQAQTAETQARTDALRNPKPEKPGAPHYQVDDEGKLHEITVGQDGKPVDQIVPGSFGKPEPGPKLSFEEQNYAEWAGTQKKAGKPSDRMTFEKQLHPKDTSGREEARGDRSYQWHAGRIDKLREPVAARMERVSRLEDTLNQSTPQADALVAPELLSVMAGGQGSGLRMNEAEIARIVGGRTNWETLKAKLGAWQTDPNKGFALTPDQREQTRALFGAVKDRVSKKMAAIDEESENLSGTDSAAEHRRIYNRLQKRLSDIDAGTSQGGQVVVTDPNGGQHTFPDQASADRFKKLAKIQ